MVTTKRQQTRRHKVTCKSADVNLLTAKARRLCATSETWWIMVLSRTANTLLLGRQAGRPRDQTRTHLTKSNSNCIRCSSVFSLSRSGSEREWLYHLRVIAHPIDAASLVDAVELQRNGCCVEYFCCCVFEIPDFLLRISCLEFGQELVAPLKPALVHED